MDWQASSASGASNGVLKLLIDGLLKHAITNIDNDTREIDWLRLGAVSGIDTGTQATYYFDAYGSTRSSYIGQHYENVTATFVYDGDGRRVKGTVNGVTTVIVGDHYDVRTDGEGEVTREYYSAGGGPVAVRELPSGRLSWLITDRLGSLSAVADPGGVLTAELRYRAFGEVRYAAGILPTSYQYTGQRAEPLLGLYDYRARWYDPGVARFTQADTMVPRAGEPAAWDRYAYVFNPVRYSDPSGNRLCEGGKCWQDEKGYFISELGAFGLRAGREISVRGLSVLLSDMQILGVEFARIMSAEGNGADLVHKAIGEVRVGYGDLDGLFCQTQNAQSITCAPGKIREGIILHEIGHVLNMRLGLGPQLSLAATTMVDSRGAHITGADPSDEGDFRRTWLGYRGKAEPYVWAGKKHWDWNTPWEDFADMFYNWAVYGFAEDEAGTLRYDWVEQRIPGWLGSLRR